MKLAWGKAYRRRISSGEHVPKDRAGTRAGSLVIVRPPPRVPKPFSWWVAQADQVSETCAKCEGAMEGVYVPPTQETMGECAVIAHCRCGIERVVIAGRDRVPYDDQTRGTVKPPRVKGDSKGARSRRVMNGQSDLRNDL